MGNRENEQQYPDPALQNQSGSRPPHFNQAVCGCRCGRASGHGQGSNEDDGRLDDTATLVTSDTSDDDFGLHSESTLGEDIETSHLVAGHSAFHEYDARVDGAGISGNYPSFSGPGSDSDGANSMENELGSGRSIWRRLRFSADALTKMYVAYSRRRRGRFVACHRVLDWVLGLTYLSSTTFSYDLSG